MARNSHMNDVCFPHSSHTIVVQNHILKENKPECTTQTIPERSLRRSRSFSFFNNTKKQKEVLLP